MRNRRRGFTLIEVMMATVVFVGSMAGFFRFYVTLARLTESSRNLTQALNDARVLMEAMRDTAQTGGLTGASGVTGLYVQGTDLAPGFGLASLQNEAISATYADPAADPLQVSLQVSWDEWGHARSATFDTLVTQR